MLLADLLARTKKDLSEVQYDLAQIELQKDALEFAVADLTERRDLFEMLMLIARALGEEFTLALSSGVELHGNGAVEGTVVHVPTGITWYFDAENSESFQVGRDGTRADHAVRFVFDGTTADETPIANYLKEQVVLTALGV
jgi:hypothetical protein